MPARLKSETTPARSRRRKPPLCGPGVKSATLHAAEGRPTPKSRRPWRTNLSAGPAEPKDHPKDQRTHLRAYGPRTHQGLSYKLYLASHQCFQDFAGHRILRSLRTLWELKLSSHQEKCPSHRRRIHVLWCSLEHKTFRILKMHGQSPLGCKVSSCSVINCCVNYLFDTGYAWHGHCHWNF